MRYDFQSMPPGNRAVSAKWQGLRQQYPQLADDIVPFSVADMELPCPPEVVEGLKRFLDTTSFVYPTATESYIQAVCGWMQRRYGWQVQPQWLLQWAGIVPTLYSIVAELVKPDEAAIIMPPVYMHFYNSVKSAGCRLLENQLIYEQGRYSIDFADLEQKAKDPAAKLLILCSPHNPVGRLWTAEELTRIGQICLDNNVLVLSDEIHADFALDGKKHTVFAAISPKFAANSITCTAPSKTFNIAGLQAANIIIPDAELRQRIQKTRDKQGFGHLNSMAYEACRLAYEEGEPWLDQLLRHIEHNRDVVTAYIEQHIPAIKVVPLEATYLLWLDCRGLGLEARELETFLRREANFFCSEGYTFGKGGAGFERLNLACPTHVLQEAMERLRVAVEKL